MKVLIGEFSAFTIKYLQNNTSNAIGKLIFWSVVLGSKALRDNISVYIGQSPREREKEELVGWLFRG